MDANLIRRSPPSRPGCSSAALVDDSIRQLRQLAYQVARRFGFSHADAEDLAQEAMVDLLQRSGEPLVTPGAWVRVVTRRKAGAAFRRGKREAPLDSVAAVGPADCAAESVPARIDLAHALDGLPRRQRDLLLGYYWLGLDLTHLSRALGLGLGNAKVLLHRARGALRAALADYDAEAMIPALAATANSQPDAVHRRCLRRIANGAQSRAKSEERRAKSKEQRAEQTANASRVGVGSAVERWGLERRDQIREKPHRRGLELTVATGSTHLPGPLTPLSGQFFLSTRTNQCRP